MICPSPDLATMIYVKFSNQWCPGTILVTACGTTDFDLAATGRDGVSILAAVLRADLIGCCGDHLTADITALPAYGLPTRRRLEGTIFGLQCARLVAIADL